MPFVRRPSYFKNFTCIASACTDSCCQGWEIDIDEETLAFYQQVPGEFGKRLADNIALPEEGSDEPAHFIQCDRERCPFLNDRELCDIILTIGEEHISQICTHHPRYYDWTLDGEEAGLGLCCEEAARLMLQKENGPRLDVEYTDDDTEKDWESDPDLHFEWELEQMLFTMRDQLFEKVDTPADSLSEQSVAERFDTLMSDLYTLADSMQIRYDEMMFPDPEAESFEPRICSWGSVFWQADFLEDLLDFYLDLEINDRNWFDLLHELKCELTDLLDARQAFLEMYREQLHQYSNLLCYFLFRYFMKSREDSALFEKVVFALISTSMIQLLDIHEWKRTGTLTERQQINLCKLYSKEIEYDEDNMEQVSMYLDE